MLFAIPCSLSPIVSRMHPCLFSDWRRTVSSNSSTHRFPRFPSRNLCSLVTVTVSSLVYAATDTAYCFAFVSLGLAESRILPAAPADTRPKTPLISFCTIQLRTICAAHSLATLCLCATSGPGPGHFPASGAPCPHPSKGVGQQQQHINMLKKFKHFFSHSTFWGSPNAVLGVGYCLKCLVTSFFDEIFWLDGLLLLGWR